MHRLMATALVTAAFASGCGAEIPPTQSLIPGPNGAVDPWGPLAVVRGGGNGDAALTEGSLEVTDRCVFVVNQSGRTLLAWPEASTSWHADRSAIEVIRPSGQILVLRAGERWGFGGSGGPFADLVRNLDWVAPPRPECAVPDIWFLGEVIEI